MVNRPLYYLHIPKTGGTSLTSFIDSQFNADEICPAQLLPELFEQSQDSLSGYKLFRGHLWYGLNTFLNRDLAYITMLRDPIQRTISWYSHAKRDPNGYRHNRIVKENWSLLDFVHDEETNWDMINTQTLFLAVDLDYSKLARDPVGYGRSVVKDYAKRLNDRSLLDTAKRRLEQFAFFGITERMQDSINLLSYALNYYPDHAVPKLNISANRPSDKEISPETIEAIKELTLLDQELYEWARPIFEERFNQMVKSLLMSRHRINGEFIESGERMLPPEERRYLHLEITSAPSAVSASSRFKVLAAITNNSSYAIASRPPNPVRIAYHWLEMPNQSIAVFEGGRTEILPDLPVSSARDFPVSVEAPPNPGRYVLRITLVQEGIAWFDHDDPRIFSDFEIVVQ